MSIVSDSDISIMEDNTVDIDEKTALSLQLRIDKKYHIASGICVFEFVSATDEVLPKFTPGSHIKIEVPNGELRKYSLCNDALEVGRYVITVKRDADGRGGSISMVDHAKVGQIIRSRMPDNAFDLDAQAERFIFIAGGIGITPILAMIRSLAHRPEVAWHLYYLSRNPDETAYLDLLADSEISGNVTIHHSGVTHEHYDLWPVLANPGKEHVYCCGPRSLMEDVRDMSGHWSNNRIHFESFIEGGEKKPDDKPFTVTLAQSGKSLEIPVGKSILEVLRAGGVAVPFSCEAGTCGTCRTDLLDGVADHRDMVLMPEEEDHQIMVCVSRAKTENLILDR